MVVVDHNAFCFKPNLIRVPFIIMMTRSVVWCATGINSARANKVKLVMYCSICGKATEGLWEWIHVYQIGDWWHPTKYKSGMLLPLPELSTSKSYVLLDQVEEAINLQASYGHLPLPRYAGKSVAFGQMMNRLSAVVSLITVSYTQPSFQASQKLGMSNTTSI